MAAPLFSIINTDMRNLLILLLLTGCTVSYKPVQLMPLTKVTLLSDGWILAAKDTEDRVEIHTKQILLNEVMVSQVLIPGEYSEEYRKIQTDQWKLRVANVDNTDWCVKIGWQGIDYVRTENQDYVYVPAYTTIDTWVIHQEIWKLKEEYVTMKDAQWRIVSMDLKPPNNKQCV